MTWCIHIHYAPSQSLYSSRRLWMRTHDPQYCPSTPLIVTVGWLCQNLISKDWLEWCGTVAIPQGTWQGGFISTIYQPKTCVAPGRNGRGHVTLSIIDPPQSWSPWLGMPISDIQKVVEKVWSCCHTPRHILLWIYIHYAPTQSLYSSRKQWMWTHDPQYYPSTPVMVTMVGYANIWYS